MEAAIFTTKSATELIGLNKNPKFWDSVFSNEKAGDINFVINENGIWASGRVIPWTDMASLYFVKENDSDNESTSNLVIKSYSGELVTVPLNKTDRSSAEVLIALQNNIALNPQVQNPELENIGRNFSAEW